MGLNFMMWTVGRKLTVIFSVLMLIIILVSLIGELSMLKLNKNAQDINERIIPKIETVNNLEDNTKKVMSLIQRHIMSKDKSFEEKYEKELDETITNVDEIIINYRDLLDDPKEIGLFDEIVGDWDSYQARAKKIIAYSSKNEDDQAAEENYKAVVQIDEIEAKVDVLNKMHSDEAIKIGQAGKDLYKSMFIILTLSAIIGLIISIAVIRFLLRTIQRPIVQLSKKFEQMTDGDLTIENIDIKTKDELGVLGDSFNKMVLQIRGLVTSLHDHINTVASTSAQLSVSAEETSSAALQITKSIVDVSENATTQLKSAKSSSTVVEEIAQGMEQASRSIQSVSDLAISTTNYTKDGAFLMDDTVNKIVDIQKSTESTATVVQSLSAKSGEIGQIVSLITNIAEQTNLLALNAAIEAARAGEQGLGFAVVAGEVRKLAEESGRAASSISGLIDSIQQEVGEAIIAMDRSQGYVSEGLAMVEQSGKSFNEISKMVSSVSQEAEEISAITEEINASTQSMKDLVEQVERMSENTDEQSQSIAAAVEEQNATMSEISTSSRVLSTMSEKLSDMIDVFKIR